MRSALGLAWLACACLGVPSAAVQEKRLPLPDGPAQKEAERFVRDVFKDEYSQIGLPAKGLLARKLLVQGDETRDDPRVRYVLYREARDLAIQAGDPSTALKASQGIARHYEVHPLDSKLTVLSALGLTVQSQEERRTLIEECLGLANECLSREDLGTAERAAREAVALAKRMKDVPWVARAEAKSREVSGLREKLDAVKKAGEVLASRPQDPSASHTVGRHLCLTKGDWDAGLPLLARGSDAGLKALAARDLANPGEAKEQLAVADAWWDFAEKEAGAARAGLRRRSAFWYSRALPSATGLTRARIEKRLAEIDPKDAPRSTIDLLALLQLDKDTLKGTWRLTGEGLQAPADGQGIVQIPYLPPEEYDLRLVAHLTDAAEINLGLAVGSTHFIIPVDGWSGKFSGVELIDGKSSDANETSRPGKLLKSGTPNTLLCSVRKASVRLVVNGEEVIHWKADYRRLSLTPFWDRPGNGTLALGSYKGYRVTQLELIPVSGSGRPLR